jgi:hypothetical protein
MLKSIDHPSMSELGWFLVLPAAALILGGVGIAGAVAVTELILWITGSGIVLRCVPEIRFSAFRLPATILAGGMTLSLVLIIIKALFDPPASGVIFVLSAPLIGLIYRATLPVKREGPRPDPLTAGLIMSIILIFALIPVFLHVGIETASGNAYRAYFNGDFLKHVALVREFDKPGIPPRNPYFSGLALHYYWFIYPIVWWLSLLSSSIADPQKTAFIVFTLGADFLFLATLDAMLSGWAVRVKHIVIGLFWVLMAGLIFMLING